MILKIFSVYDKKADAYMQPFFSQTRGMALRSFTDAVNGEGHQFKKHAEDYALFEISSFDDNTGEVEQDCTPCLIIEAKDIITKGE